MGFICISPLVLSVYVVVYLSGVSLSSGMLYVVTIRFYLSFPGSLQSPLVM